MKLLSCVHLKHVLRPAAGAGGATTTTSSTTCSTARRASHLRGWRPVHWAGRRGLILGTKISAIALSSPKFLVWNFV